MVLQVGDKVKVRSWESMKKQFGIRISGAINISPYFIEDMQKFCGQTVTISEIPDRSCYFRIIEDGGEYHWIEDFVETLSEKYTDNKTHTYLTRKRKVIKLNTNN